MKFSIKQVRKMLGISESTFHRKVRAGLLSIEHDPTEKTRTGLPRVWVTLEAIGAFLGITDDSALRVRLGLPVEKPAEQEPEAPTVKAAPEETFTPQQTAPDVESALRDTVFEGRHTLLGPIEPQPKQKPSGTSHMTSPVADDFAAPRPLESDDFLEMWQPGHKQRMDQMYRNCGMRKPSEQEKKQVVDAAVVAAAFRQGFAR